MAKLVDKVRDLDNAELVKRDQEAREQMFRLKFQLAMGQTDGVKKYRELRKERARVATIVRERELHPETAPAASPKKKRGK